MIRLSWHGICTLCPYKRIHRDTETGSGEEWKMTEANRISLPWGTFFAGASLAGAYILCVVLDILFPSAGMKVGWGTLLPGFTRLTPTTFIPGLLETFLIGVLFAVTIIPIYNFYFSLRDRLEEIQAKRYGDRLKYI
jgi:hypothetical protein